MAPRYRRWTIRGYRRTERDDEGMPTAADVVEITEPGGWQWHLVVLDGMVVDFRMVDTGTRPVGRDDLRHVPLADLVKIATVFQERVLDEFGQGARLGDALELAEIEPGEVRLSDDSPAPEEFARAWLSIPRATVEGVPRRDALAERYGVTVWAIDKWTRKARERGLIPGPTTGRRRSS